MNQNNQTSQKCECDASSLENILNWIYLGFGLLVQQCKCVLFMSVAQICSKRFYLYILQRK